MNDSMEHILGCRLGLVSDHDLLELENATCKTNCFMLSSRLGPCVSIIAPYVVSEHYSL